jgi:hypothetical protein
MHLCSERLARDAEADCRAAAAFAFDLLRSELDNQISMRAASEIKFKLNLFDEKAKGAAALAAALDALTKGIGIDALYAESEALYRELVDKADYARLLRYYNRKSLPSQIGAVLGLKNKELPQFVLRLASGPDVDAVRAALRPYLGTVSDRIAFATRN